MLTPGPVELTRAISRAQARPLIYHRTKEYREFHAALAKKAAGFFGGDEAFIITGSGTAGLEAGIAGVAGEKDTIFVAHNGKFGERLAELSRVFCPNVAEQKFEYGKGIDLERVKGAIDAASPTIIALVYSETSTGVCNRAKEIVRYAKGKGAIAFVDGISAIGGHEFNMKEWGADVCVTGSQKCLGAPPGLALVGVGSEAMARVERNEPKAYYLSLKRYAKSQREKSETPYTPAVTLMYALDEALNLALAEGLEKRVERHRKAGRMVRRRLGEMGFAMFAEKGFESNTVTAFRVDSPEQAEKIMGGLGEMGMVIAGGQGEMNGKILRIGHMGNFKTRNLKACLDAIGDLK